jgi:plastocyanin
MLQPTRHRGLPRPIITASVSFLLLGLAACGSDSKSSSTTAAPSAAATTPAAAATTPAATATTPAATETTLTDAGAAGTAVEVKESEFKIELPQTSFAAGTYTFNITNSGQFKHNVIVEGNGTKVQSDTLDGGATGTISVPLTAGTYEVYCGVPTHKGKGMDLTITVT